VRSWERAIARGRCGLDRSMGLTRIRDLSTDTEVRRG
jgi:hypothetical protein